MNILKKIYCRIFQFCFKVSIPLLPYYNPVILKKFDDIPAVLKEKKISRLLLVTDRGVRKIGLTQKLETLLSENGIEVTVFDGVVSNPTVENVEDAKDLYLTNNCQALIGFGGGSAIDCAKATGACIANPKRSIIDMAGILKVFKKIPLLFAIPTTAGTGTETTVATLITDSLTKRKYMISDFPLIPKYAVLDPETTRTIPKSITAYSGVDVLVHAVEAYIGNSTTPKTRHQALEATRLVFENLKNAYEDGNNMKARENMMWASYLAGCAFTVSYVGYCHAVAHSLGGKYNTHHGLANAVLIPYVLEAYGDKIHKQLKELAISAGLVSENTPKDKASEIFIQAIKDLNKQMNISAKLPEVKKEDIRELAYMAEKESNPVYPVPVLMGVEELEQFFYDVLEENETNLTQKGELVHV